MLTDRHVTIINLWDHIFIISLSCNTLREVNETHFNILAWKILRIEEPGGLQFMGSQRFRYNLVTKQHPITHIAQSHMYDISKAYYIHCQYYVYMLTWQEIH